MNCGNCKYCSISKGSYAGTYEYWCRIQHGQKHENYCCDLYEEEKTK